MLGLCVCLLLLFVSFSSFVASKNGRCSNNYAEDLISLKLPAWTTGHGVGERTNELGRGETVETLGHIALSDLQVIHRRRRCAEISAPGMKAKRGWKNSSLSLAAQCPKVQRTVIPVVLSCFVFHFPFFVFSFSLFRAD